MFEKTFYSMKKFIVSIMPVVVLIISATGCSMQKHQKQTRNYSSDRFHHADHADYDRDRDHRYTPPRQY